MKHLAWLFLIIPLAAQSATATLTWNAPTTCKDGSTDTSKCSVQGYRVYAGAPGAAKVIVQTTAPNVLTYSATIANTTCYDVTAFNGIGESLHTAEVCKQVDSLAPGTPGNTVLASNAVFTVTKGVDKFVMIAVGTVPAGTACITNQCVLTDKYYCAVPSNAVNWAGTVRAQLVVAACG